MNAGASLHSFHYSSAHQSVGCTLGWKESDAHSIKAGEGKNQAQKLHCLFLFGFGDWIVSECVHPQMRCISERPNGDLSFPQKGPLASNIANELPLQFEMPIEINA